jgi:hypothetical protein
MKNIILCSDGTGNSGDHANSTNVFKLYKTVELQSTNQLSYYDDGIGSTGNKYIKIISGALGFGFKANLISLYSYLVRHYEPGDKVYLFGFSRGAATIRALAGMIEVIGLLRADYDEITTGGRVDSIKLKIKMYTLMHLYKHRVKHTNEIAELKEKHTHGAIDIEMVGVWDTVSALGFPQDSSWLVVGVSKILEVISERISPYRFFNYQLNKNVKNAYHALAIDDDRYTFHPLLWDEKNEARPVNIEQVWFTGAHANVGGGYPRTGLSSIPLDWMLERAKKHGIIFNEDMCEDVKAEMNDAGKLYDPRSGMHVYYRFSPRHIKNLTTRKASLLDLFRNKPRTIPMLDGEIKIHKSVIDRIHKCKYAPILPNRFEIVSTDSSVDPVLYVQNEDEVKCLKRKINRLIKMRVWLYHISTELSVAIAYMMWYLSMYRVYEPVDSTTYNTVVKFLPMFSDNFLYYCTYERPLVGITLVILSAILYILYKVFRILNDRIRKRINWWLIGDIK